MRNFLYGLFVGAMIMAIVVGFMDGMAATQEERDLALVNKIDSAPVGKTIQLRGKGFFVTSSKGRVTDEMFEEDK